MLGMNAFRYAVIRKSVMSAFLFLFAFALVSCGTTEHQGHGKNIMEHSDLLALYERDGYDEVFVVDTQGKEVAHYVLVDRNDSTRRELPEGAIKIKVPLQNAIMDSEIYAGAFEELKSADVIKGMFDASYATSPQVQNRIKEGSIVDLGQSSSPNAEKIVAMKPDAIMISFFEGMATQGIDKLGVPIIKMYDLQESSPLGRAEWIKLIGRLAGKEEMADSIFDAVETAYDSVKENVKNLEGAWPKVLTETIYEGVWSVPGGMSYQAALLKDAGGKYFKENDNSPVSINLTAEQVLSEGGDADIWLIRFYGDEEALKAILNADPVYKDIKAYKDGNVYFSDTSSSGLFREFPFHPDLLLKDYSIIFSGDSIAKTRYFKKLN